MNYRYSTFFSSSKSIPFSPKRVYLFFFTSSLCRIFTNFCFFAIHLTFAGMTKLITFFLFSCNCGACIIKIISFEVAGLALIFQLACDQLEDLYFLHLLCRHLLHFHCVPCFFSVVFFVFQLFSEDWCLLTLVNMMISYICFKLYFDNQVIWWRCGIGCCNQN